MKKQIYNITGKLVIVFACLLFCTTACREKYVPEITSPVTGYLVVDGFINSGTGPTTIYLSRTTKLSAVAGIVREGRAIVRVENKGNTSVFVLSETTTGVYTNPQLALNPNEQYRLYVKTFAGKEYVSDYSSVRRTPDIDSVSWRVENGGVQIYANSHNNQEPAGYYQYKYEETWIFHSRYGSRLKVFKDSRGQASYVGYRDSSTYGIDSSLFRCWKSDTSTSIKVYSTEKLTQNVVSLYPLVFIPRNDWRLDKQYSINVRQYSLSKEGLRFLEQLKKNTEQLGSIFDAQPSDNNGNMHCLTVSSEPVIGFIEVTEEKLKRIFINNTQLPGWVYPNTCDDEMIVDNEAKQLGFYDGYFTTRVAVDDPNTGGIDSVFFAKPVCVDCTLRGTNKKPSFWP